MKGLITVVGGINTRTDLINHFIKERNYKRYLEIGVANGDNFNAVECEHKVSVDPFPDIAVGFKITSDMFFEQNDERFDIVFIDGFHEWKQALRDVRNALLFLEKGGVVIMHDCHPVSEECAMHVSEYRKPTSAWCGDVWKAFVKLRSFLPYLTYVWDHDWGCGVIDTSVPNTNVPPAIVPSEVALLTYRDFINHPEWMNFKEDVQCL